MEYRLKRRNDFDTLFQKGKKVYTSSFKLLYLSSNDFKVGYSLSKKHGKAHIRNRIKRLLRSAFRNFMPQLKKNYRFVFVPKICEDYSYDVFVRDMNYVFKKENLFNEVDSH